MEITSKDFVSRIRLNKKRFLIILAALISVIAFIVPFFFKSCTDTTLSVLSSSFSAVGAVATLFTLYIAVVLYQRFGLESKFVERKADTVLELAELLKGKTIIIKHGEMEFPLRNRKADIENAERIAELYGDFYKTIVLYKSVEDYQEFFRPIINFSASPWLPDEIREKIKYLTVTHYGTQLDFKTGEKFSIIDFGKSKIDKAILPLPVCTVEDFVKGYFSLNTSIDDWLQKHCDIKIDLRPDDAFLIPQDK